MTARALSWARSYWQGRVSPAFAVVVVVIGGRLAVLWLLRRLPADLPDWAMICLGLADLAFLLWQVTGAFRATRQELEGQSATMAVWGCHAAILGAVGVAAYGLVDLAASDPLISATPVISQAGLPRDGAKALLSGEIDYDAMRALDVSLAGARPPGILQLDSKGGLVHAARAIARRVETKRMGTEVTGACFSACTLIFMAGSSRQLGPDGQLGFHGYAYRGVAATSDIASEEAHDAAFFTARGLSTDFVARIFAAPHDRIWFPSRGELIAAGVLTR